MTYECSVVTCDSAAAVVLHGTGIKPFTTEKVLDRTRLGREEGSEGKTGVHIALGQAPRGML